MEYIINVILTDDSQIAIEGLSFLLAKKRNFRILDTCRNGLELVNNENLNKANLLFIDVDMPVMDGLEAASKIRKIHPDLHMIAVSMHEDDAYIDDYINVGFNGFILKQEINKKLFEVIHKVLNGEFVFPKTGKN